MAVYLDDVAYWVREWAATGEPISANIARTIASYWAESGVLTQFALGQYVDTAELLEAAHDMHRYARSSGMFEPTLPELRALIAWIEGQ